ncbi:uncharacterized protein I303_100101 [Kwoniella dejecticola CBS 10117]|uniref:Myb-like domain-containing protein n=1 Tax=Kwoniella dejecticola CBS 10117 TaxID=1296121 RepID=A0A1A6AE01_9TREE|nr:uncharacterized protein I303_00101 [Kwoniella dejecticola CBS 10117]OBR88290.1 hypothetical protein I303_00101 [Kwoniella dejecticola CBS 10117]
MPTHNSIKRSLSSSPLPSADFPADMKPLVSSPVTPKKIKGNKTIKAETPNRSSPDSTPQKAKTNGSGFSPASEGWTARDRLELFEAIVGNVDIKWNEVSLKMSSDFSPKQCRDQWHRNVGKKLRKALSEE